MYDWRSPKEHRLTAKRVIEWQKRRQARRLEGVHPTPFADRMKIEEEPELPAPLTWLEGMKR